MPFLDTLFPGFIELGQLLTLSDRLPEVRDLLSDSTEFLLGAIASVAFRMIVAHQDALVERDRRAAVRAGPQWHYESSNIQPSTTTTTREPLKAKWATIALPNRLLRPASMPTVIPTINVVAAANHE